MLRYELGLPVMGAVPVKVPPRVKFTYIDPVAVTELYVTAT
jgi:hypothetical protein